MAYYVLLTGAKNNVGDFLIALRARELLRQYRPDREVYELPRWEEVDAARLELINGSEAVLLTGGPAIQRNMASGVFRLSNVLEKIKVPIISYGIGWKDPRGRFEDTRRYALDSQAKLLLQAINESGYRSSVRDYRTLSMLQQYGFDSFVVSGCPALFQPSTVSHSSGPAGELRDWRPKRVTFSAGVSFATNRSMRRQMLHLIDATLGSLHPPEFTVAFHHGTSPEYLKSPDPNHELWSAQKSLIQYLESRSIPWIDISGDAGKMLDHYRNQDLHVGYRVHAHILMSSEFRPSILIAEDGRGIGLTDILGGRILTAFEQSSHSVLRKGLGRLKIVDRVRARPELVEEFRESVMSLAISADIASNQVRAAVELHRVAMVRFLESLP